MLIIRIYYYNYLTKIQCIDAKRKRGCDKKAVKKDWIEDLVINQIDKVLWNDEFINRLAVKILEFQSQENTTLPLLKKQLSETEKGIDNILNAIQQGIFTASTRQRLEDLENQKKDIEIRIAKEKIEKPLLTKDHIIFWFERLRKYNVNDIKHRRRLVDSFVNSIILHDDKIEFYFNFKEGSETLTLTELEKCWNSLGSLPPKTDKFRLVGFFMTLVSVKVSCRLCVKNQLLCGWRQKVIQK